MAQPMPSVIHAAKQADWEELQVLLNDGADPNAAYGDGTTSLHWASYHDDISGVKMLTAAGAEVDATNDLGVTPLWLAAENGNSAITKLLLDRGSDPNIALTSGETVVMTAAQSGNPEVVRLVLAAGGDPNKTATRNQTALMWAAEQGDSEVVRSLLEYGADVSARTATREQLMKSDKEQESHPEYKHWVVVGGNTPLIFAARSGDLESVTYIVDAGADVNELTALGTSPLIMAVNSGNPEVVEYLIERGADIESDVSGHTALHDAVLRGNLEVVDILLARGANTEAVVTDSTPARRQSTDYHYHESLIGATPLWLAARFSEPEIMKALIENGANPHAINNVSYPAQRMGDNFIAEEGNISVLMAAVGMGNPRLRLSWGATERRARQIDISEKELKARSVKMALDAGIDIHISDTDGRTALDFARARSYDALVDLILASGMNG